MSNTILIKKSGTANAVPLPVNLALGELAINYTDGNLFYKDNTGTVKLLASNQVLDVFGNITGGNLLTGGIVSAAGNVTGANLTTAGLVTSTGNVIGGNINTAGQVSATGNVTGDYILGNITFATGYNTTKIFNGLSEVNIATANGNANISIDGTGNVAVFSTTGAYVTGVMSASGNVTGANLNTGGIVSAVGNIIGVSNITGGNLLTSGIISAAGNVLTANLILHTANDSLRQTGSNASVNLAGSVTLSPDTAASALNGVVIGGNGYLLAPNGARNAVLNYNGGSGHFGAFVLNVYGNQAGAILNGGANGVGNVGNATGRFNTFYGLGLDATGNVVAGNLNTGGQVSATGNVSGNYILGNIFYATGTSASRIYNGVSEVNIPSADGNANISINGTSNVAVFATTGVYVTGVNSASGNVTGANINTGGVVSATGNIEGGNVNTGGLISAGGNVTAANFDTTGLITATGNVTGGNIVTVGAVDTPVVTNTGGALTLQTTSNGNINLYPNGTGNVVLSTTYINKLKDPVQDQDAATKNYVDNMVAAGIDIHPAVQNDVDVGDNLNATYADGGTTPTWTSITSNTTLNTGSAHGLSVNDVIVFDTTTNGLTAGTPYFVYSVPSSTSITLSDNYSGEQLLGLTNGSITLGSLANSGVGATLTSNTNGPLTYEGYTAALNDRILVLGQTTQTENGVYYVTQVGVAGGGGSPWILTRATDGNKYIPNSPNGLDQGAYFLVIGGNDAGEAYVCNTVGTIVFGTTNITFGQFSQVNPYTAGDGLTLTNYQFSVNVDNNTTAIVAGNVVVKAGANLTTPNIGAATGTSLSVTGNLTGANINTSGLVSASGNVIAGNVTTAGLISATGNITGGNLSGTNVTGTLTTAAQPNVTSLGVLNELIVANTILADGYSARTGSDLPISVLGANANIVIKPNGTGITDFYNKPIGNISTASVIGNVNGGNVNTAIVSATGNVIGANINTGGLITATGNVTGGNINTGGLISATGNITSVGNISGGNILASSAMYVGGDSVLTVNSTVDGGTY